METWSNWIFDNLGIGDSFQYKIVTSLIVIAVVSVLRRIIVSFLEKQAQDLKSRYNWAKNVSYFSYFLILAIITPIWIVELQSLGTFLGLLSAGLAVALKEPITNWFAWIYIVIKKPFEMGDRIQIDNSEGDILDIGFFEFTMLEIKNWVHADQSTGRIIHVPNGLLFSTPIKNYNQAMNYIWDEISTTITFESDWEKAKSLLLEIEKTKLTPLTKDVDKKFNEAKTKYYVNYPNLDPTVYTRIRKSGVELTIRYLCPPTKRRDFEQIASESILREFKKHEDIRFAYPTTRFFTENTPNSNSFSGG